MEMSSVGRSNFFGTASTTDSCKNYVDDVDDEDDDDDDDDDDVDDVDDEDGADDDADDDIIAFLVPYSR